MSQSVGLKEKSAMLKKCKKIFLFLGAFLGYLYFIFATGLFLGFLMLMLFDFQWPDKEGEQKYCWQLLTQKICIQRETTIYEFKNEN